MFISGEYKTLLQEKHKGKWGDTGSRYAPRIRDLMGEVGAETLIDYGCGKGNLADLMDLTYNVQRYDPGIPEYDHHPRIADFTACIDVLEHVEPEYIDDVLAHISLLSRKGAFLVIHTRAAKHTLSDGRNAHLIQEGFDWWDEKISKYFKDYTMYEELPNLIVEIKKGT